MFFDNTLGDTFDPTYCQLWGGCGATSGGGTYNTTGSYNTGVPWWQTVLNQGIGLTSQIIGAWGHNQTQQIGWNGMPIGSGYSPAAINQSQAQIQAAIAQQNAAQYALTHGGTGQGGLGLDDAAGSITAFVQRNPLLVFGGIAAVFLLMRQPPGSRR